MSNSELACQILERTNDGSKLSPEHLGLLEDAVNGNLNDLGNKMFKDLHTQVIEDRYTKPWFMGVEHVTIDHEWYVYWKGIHVEHFTLSIKDNDWKKDTEELAEVCRSLEAANIPVTAHTYIKHCFDGSN